MSAISSIKEKLLELYASKTASEQKLIQLAGIFFSIFLIHSIYTSVNDGLATAEDKLQKQTELNSWAREQIQRIQNSSGGASSNRNSGSITQVINSSARKFGVSIARLQPQKTDMVKVGIDQIGFNRLIRWLAELENRHGIEASNIDVSKADESGLVKIRRLDLERS